MLWPLNFRKKYEEIRSKLYFRKKCEKCTPADSVPSTIARAGFVQFLYQPAARTDHRLNNDYYYRMIVDLWSLISTPSAGLTSARATLYDGKHFRQQQSGTYIFRGNKLRKKIITHTATPRNNFTHFPIRRSWGESETRQTKSVKKGSI